MPRNGSGIYERPPGTDGAPDTTIESAKYNAFVADAEQDLNTPRPIVAGGTGAINARDAMIALNGEVAKQIVDNYDSYPFISGSFSSDATPGRGAPVNGHAFTGNAVIHNDPLFATLTAHDLSDTTVPGRNYIREKKAGVWSVWKADGRTIIADAEGIAVDAADMFFGVEGTAPDGAFIVNTKKDNSGVDLLRATKNGLEVRATSGQYNFISMHKSGANISAGLVSYSHTGKFRWTMYFGDGTNEAGANAGSNFSINRYDDAASVATEVLNINRATGDIVVAAKVTAGSFTTAGALSVGSIVIAPGNFQVSNNASTGFYGDGSNIAIRTYNNTASSKIYFQSAAGATSMGTIDTANMIMQVPIASAGQVSGLSLYTSGGSVYFNAPGTVRWTWDGTRLVTPNNTAVEGTLTVAAAMIAGPSGVQIHNGLTFASGQLIPRVEPGALAWNAYGGMEIRGAGGAADAWFTFHRPAEFACNFGLATDHNIYYGGQSFGQGVWHRFLTTRDGASIVSSVRTTHVGDFSHNYPNGIEEPFGSSAVVTGISMGYSNMIARYRQLQQFINGAWGNIEAT